MGVIDAVLGTILGQIVQQVADVVQEGGGNQRGPRPGLFRGPGGLQGVLRLADRFADVGGVAPFLEQRSTKSTGSSPDIASSGGCRCLL